MQRVANFFILAVSVLVVVVVILDKVLDILDLFRTPKVLGEDEEDGYEADNVFPLMVDRRRGDRRHSQRVTLTTEKER